MLATLGSPSDVALGGDPDDPDAWAFEMKWDGIRAIATVRNGDVSLRTRNGNDITAVYPELAELGEQVRGDAVLDGEIVAMGPTGRPDFGLLQTRMKLTRPREVEAVARRTPVEFMVFDILAADLPKRSDADLTAMSYNERRDILARVVSESGRIQVPPAFEGDLESALETSRALGLEGVMAKRRSSQYSIGRRSRAWIKLKHHRTQEVVVGGWRPGNGRRANTVGSLLLGVPTSEGLRYVGRVGTGFSDRDLVDIAALLARHSRVTSPFVDVPPLDARDASWVRPTLVGEVEFAEWTATRRLRQPSWRGWRPDKSAKDVTFE